MLNITALRPSVLPAHRVFSYFAFSVILCCRLADVKLNSSIHLSASLVVDDVTKMCFSTPVLVFQPPSTPQNFGWPRHFGADFSFKIAKIIIAYYTQFIPALAGHLLEMWKIWPEKSILTENSKYNLKIQWQSCKRLKHLKKQRLVQMSSNLGVLNGYRILEQLPDLW